MEYRYGSHTVYQIEYHFVWVTKYRYKVLSGEVRGNVARRIGGEPKTSPGLLTRDLPAKFAMSDNLLGSIVVGPGTKNIPAADGNRGLAYTLLLPRMWRHWLTPVTRSPGAGAHDRGSVSTPADRQGIPRPSDCRGHRTARRTGGVDRDGRRPGAGRRW